MEIDIENKKIIQQYIDTETRMIGGYSNLTLSQLYYHFKSWYLLKLKIKHFPEYYLFKKVFLEESRYHIEDFRVYGITFTNKKSKL